MSAMDAFIAWGRQAETGPILYVPFFLFELEMEYHHTKFVCLRTDLGAFCTNTTIFSFFK